MTFSYFKHLNSKGHSKSKLNEEDDLKKTTTPTASNHNLDVNQYAYKHRSSLDIDKQIKITEKNEINLVDIS